MIWIEYADWNLSKTWVYHITRSCQAPALETNESVSAADQSRRHGGGFSGLIPPQTKLQAPQIEAWNTLNKLSFG